MEGKVHRSVEVNDIKMHVAEKGEGPVVLFLHGFPELWYSWRHQIVALSSLGYRAVAPDLRGFGDTEAPSSTSNYTCFHMVGDMVALIETLGVDQVFLVTHDWGARGRARRRTRLRGRRGGRESTRECWRSQRRKRKEEYKRERSL
ncbi:hypothetical protein Fmac_031066 [Flemingia macrophylla]|uniref:AB hydrolase-1 domain-containing protein n=1 Tax=Flemingia macrophylla TaxID=520843 RepID=A0ABD1L0Z2_9FABA